MSLREAIRLMAIDGSVPEAIGESLDFVVERVMHTLSNMFLPNTLHEVTVELMTLSADELWETCCATQTDVEVTQLTDDVLDAAFLAL
jgi:hypothetical protein